MEIVVNGDVQTVPAEATILDLLTELDMKPKYVAVERNEKLVPRREHANCRLEPGDRIEIVTLVGGG